MTLLTEFPNIQQVYAALIALLVVNAITAGIAIWTARDLRHYRRYHREEMDKLKALFPAKRPSKTLTFAMPLIPYPEEGIEEKGVGGFRYPEVVKDAPIILGDYEWNEGETVFYGTVPAVVLSDPKKSKPGYVQIGYLRRVDQTVQTTIVGSGSLKERRLDLGGKFPIDEAIKTWLQTSMVD